jgi:hypothetical protein
VTTTPLTGPPAGQGCLIAFSGVALAFGGCTVYFTTDFTTVGVMVAMIGVCLVPVGLVLALVVATGGRKLGKDADHLSVTSRED